jgi:3-keto-5-aminohexanoate cleavage enzyme
MDKLIINCCITGSRITKGQTPHIPITPEEIIRSAIEAWETGAAIVHIHVRDQETGLGTQDVNLFQEVSEGIKSRCNVIQCMTTSGIPGVNLPSEQRLAPLNLESELISLDCGSKNFGKLTFICDEDFIELAARKALEKGIKPELEIFDLGMIETCKKLIDQNLLRKPYYFGFILGTPSGAPANIRTLATMIDSLPPDCIWFVGGIGKDQLPITSLALSAGGHVRVGLEDNIYYSGGVLAKSNAELVSRIVRIARELGRDVASPDEAREVLHLTSDWPQSKAY